MPDSELVAGHYTHGGLLDAIRQGVLALGKTTETVGLEDLGPVDEFHIGGRVATEAFLGQLGIDASHRVLDVGCGLGGASRFAANRYGCRVTGVDLTREYVETGNVICAWLGLQDRVALVAEDATRLSAPAESFDRVYMLHVGMNIADKRSLFEELYRVTSPGGRIGVYDVMRVGDGEPTFPVPWAAEPGGSSVATPAEYRSALESAGFSILKERDRRDFALEFFARLKATALEGNGPPPLGLHILMGDSAPVKISNMIGNISRNILAPVEIFAEKTP